MANHVIAINRKIEEYKFVDGVIYHKLTSKAGHVQVDWKPSNPDTFLRIYSSVEAYWDFLVSWAKKHPKHTIMG